MAHPFSIVPPSAISYLDGCMVFCFSNFVSSTILCTYYQNSKWGSAIINGSSGESGAPAATLMLPPLVVGNELYLYIFNELNDCYQLTYSAGKWSNSKQGNGFGPGVGKPTSVCSGTTTHITYIDSGTIYDVYLDNDQWQWRQVNLTNGVKPNAPAATGNPICFYTGSEFHIVYPASGQIVDVWTDGTNWYRDTVLSHNGLTVMALGLDTVQTPNGRFLVSTFATGTVHCFGWNDAKKDWDMMLFGITLPTAAAAAQIGGYIDHLMICYADSSGNVQQVRQVANGWENYQVTGTGSTLPNAPKIYSKPSVIEYAGQLHITYTTPPPTGLVWDVFNSGGQWYSQELVPKPPNLD